MSNIFLPERFAEGVHRLAVGVQPIDAIRRARFADGLAVALDAPRGGVGNRRPVASSAAWLAGLPRFERHDSGRFALRHHPWVRSPVVVRVWDATGRRRIVPRRLRLRILSWADLMAAEADLSQPQPTAADRTFELGLHPGAGYELSTALTVLRGSVRFDGRPLRWPRVEAFRPARNGTPEVSVGIAHGDDRGEWLLVLDTGLLRPGEVSNPFPVVLRVHGRTPPALPTQEAEFLTGSFGDAPTADPARERYLRERVADPFWDLPIEPEFAAVGAGDQVLTGRRVPGGLVRSASVDTPVPNGGVVHGGTTYISPIEFVPV